MRSHAFPRVLALPKVGFVETKPFPRGAQNRGETMDGPGRSSVALQGNTRRGSACVKAMQYFFLLTRSEFHGVSKTESGHRALFSPAATAFRMDALKVGADPDATRKFKDDPDTKNDRLRC